ncbi:MAG TPA: ATPase, T2SS/T4P/T4SS family [Candidatus Nanoarchaeia archaeon]|nr:ATPase, T2SS/T4P/T4SS family [Candidatus Nanoarchaeia archaeon]
MALFKKKIKPGEHEVQKEGPEEVIHINYESYPRIPTIEDDPLVMSSVIEKLSQSPSVSRIVFHQKKKYEYNYNQTQMLVEIAQIYNHYIKQKSLLTQAALEVFGPIPEAASRIRNLQNIILNLLRTDPIGAFVETKRLLREEKINQSKISSEEYKSQLQPYISILTDIYSLLLNTKLLANAVDFVDGYSIGSREVYKKLFQPTITPDFMYTRLASTPPLDAEQIDAYKLEKNSYVQIFNTKDTIKPLYHIIPPEFQISEDKYELLELARKVLSEHQPKAEEFIDPEKMRTTFFNIGKDLLTELAQNKRVNLDYGEVEELAHILVKYTVGFGLIESLLQDPDVQDIAINSPAGTTPIFLVHSKYDECITNIIPSPEDVESWSSKFRLISARPLDEANPVLDTELNIPGARARVAIISRPLNPTGTAFSIRRHRDDPWTLPLFVKNGMINDLAAGLLSFIIDGARTILIAGTRGSGKTSLIGSVLVEIMRKFRVLVIEDSVTGDSEILIRKAGKVERTTIANIIDQNIDNYGSWYDLADAEIIGNYENFEILSMDKSGKIKWTKPNKLIRHKVSKPIYKVTTKTGKIIRVTGDHSLFGLKKDAEIGEIKVNELKIQDFIATSRKIPENVLELKEINILDFSEKFSRGYLFGECIKSFLEKNKKEIHQLGKEYKHDKSLINKWIRKGIIPIKIINDLKCLGYNLNELKEASFKVGSNANAMPLRIKIDKDLLLIIGLWLSDGCYDKSSVLFSVPEEKNREIIYNFAKKINSKVKMHSDGITLMLNSSTFKQVMLNVLDIKGNAYTKRIPNWVFNLSKEQISPILKGIYSGDGYVSDKEIVMGLSSRKLLEDIQNLLLNFGIILRIGKFKQKDKTYPSSISSMKFIKLFKDNIGFLPNYKSNSLINLCLKINTHDNKDVIPLSMDDKLTMKKITHKFNTADYITRNNNVGREKMGKILQQIQIKNLLAENIQKLVESDLYWDQIRSIEIDDCKDVYVYDLSVPENESFLVGGIVAHNTREIPVDALSALGYDIQPMKVRSALLKSGAEMSADEGIRTSLRMGDSALIIGEVRSLEALALYEAMRTGALANVVAGTIHGDSPYGVFDRVVNDLKVPKTSFKATDIIVVANPVKTADGLHRKRRVTQITEVRKDWVEDPLREAGFIDLMIYDSKLDCLVPTDELINGDSEIIKSIASQIKEWAGNWDAVWSNIELRAKMKKTLVEYSDYYKVPDLIESKDVIQLNDEFHRISDQVTQDLGHLDSKIIFEKWEKYLKNYIGVNYKKL